MKTPDQKEKDRAYSRTYRAANLEQARKVRREYMRRKNGYPTPAYPETDACECCGKPKDGRSLNLDHDHATGKFRGWLCDACNRGMGLLKDSPTLLRKAADYLESRSATHG